MSAALRRALAQRYLDAWFLAAITVGATITFWALEPSWLNSRTLPAIVSQNAALAIVAMAMTFAIISRHIDLSPGSMVALCGAIVGLSYEHGSGIVLALLAGLGVALAVGVAHGLLVARLGLNAIMVTLAAYIWARGLALGFTGADPIVVDTWLSDVMNHTVAGFTVTAPLVLVTYVAGAWALRRTRLGRYTYAMGGDPVGARRAGIPTGRYTVAVFVLMGVAIWLATTIVVGQLASAQPYAAGGLELDAIIAVIIGGSRLVGGEGGVGRTALGVAFISILNSGLLNLGLTDASYQLWKGAALLGVLSVQIWLRRLVAEDDRRRQDAEQLGPVPA